MKKIVFRVDSSFVIGSGHLYRCMTLAKKLAEYKVESHFICRNLNGNLNALIVDHGFGLTILAEPREASFVGLEGCESWLGVTQREDSLQCEKIIKQLNPRWVVVDHYGIGFEWEKNISEYCEKICVIDDLANRKHNCELLVDQNFGRSEVDYVSLVPPYCTILCGAKFAILREDFRVLRRLRKLNQSHPSYKKLLIFMGGKDNLDLTSRVLADLRHIILPTNWRFLVVLGLESRWEKEVKQLSLSMPALTEVLVNVNNMAEVMASCDLAIGSPGTSTWERCCLGLPSLMIIQAENQKMIAKNLSEAGAAIALDAESDLGFSLKDAINNLLSNDALRASLSKLSSEIIDGDGVERIADYLK